MTGCRFLLLLTAVALLGCQSWRDSMDTKMIERNQFSERQGMRQMKSDVEECGMLSVREKQRLKAQLWDDDTYLADQERSQAAGGAVGREVGEGWVRPNTGSGPPKARANGEIDTERLAGSAGAAAGGFIWGALTSDTSKHEARMLTYDIDSLETYTRLKNACLRAKGYAVPERAEDGAAVPELRADPLRVMLVHEDGRETVMYQRPEDD